MLFILTGDVQIGKTRWLTRLLEKVSDLGVTPFGVTSPGIWEEKQKNGQTTYEKLGIEAVLWPERCRIAFATRKDLAQVAGTYDEASQSAQEKLGWAIDDAAIKIVNDYFDELALRAVKFEASEKGLLVVDELGRLELRRGGGFSSAVALLKKGPTNLYDHAMIIARSTLVKNVYEQFASCWPSMVEIRPNKDGVKVVLESVSLALND